MNEKDDGWVGFFKANPSFAPILLLILVLAFTTAPFHPQVCADKENYPCKDLVRYNFLAGIVSYLNTYSGAVIAIFTGTLWISTRRQAILTRDSVNLAREEFIASHRPEITIRGIFISRPEEKRKVSTGGFTIHNSGSSLAKIVEIIFYMNCSTADMMVSPSVQLASPSALPAEIKAGYNIMAFFTVSEDLWRIWPEDDDTSEDGVSLEFRITINYEDIMGARRQTSAFREYDFGNFRFRRIGDSEFEYKA